MAKQQVIRPTVGRSLHFIDSAPSADRGEHAAIVVKVWNDRLVNLTVFDENGNPSGRTSVALIQPGDSLPETGAYAKWPRLDPREEVDTTEEKK